MQMVHERDFALLRSMAVDTNRDTILDAQLWTPVDNWQRTPKPQVAGSIPVLPALQTQISMGLQLHGVQPVNLRQRRGAACDGRSVCAYNDSASAIMHHDGVQWQMKRKGKD
jgi:hypothetical protein